MAVGLEKTPQPGPAPGAPAAGPWWRAAPSGPTWCCRRPPPVPPGELPALDQRPCAAGPGHPPVPAGAQLRLAGGGPVPDGPLALDLPAGGPGRGPGARGRLPGQRALRDGEDRQDRRPERGQAGGYPPPAGGLPVAGGRPAVPHPHRPRRGRQPAQAAGRRPGPGGAGPGPHRGGTGRGPAPAAGGQVPAQAAQHVRGRGAAGRRGQHPDPGRGRRRADLCWGSAMRTLPKSNSMFSQPGGGLAVLQARGEGGGQGGVLGGVVDSRRPRP